MLEAKKRVAKKNARVIPGREADKREDEAVREQKNFKKYKKVKKSHGLSQDSRQTRERMRRCESQGVRSAKSHLL